MAGMPDVKSGGDAYYMPAIGYVRKDGNLSYGIGLFSQGGMGTEYVFRWSLMSGRLVPADTRSELGVGRLIVPLTYRFLRISTLAARIDFVWATLDLKMAASTAMLGSLVTGASGNDRWCPWWAGAA